MDNIWDLLFGNPIDNEGKNISSVWDAFVEASYLNGRDIEISINDRILTVGNNDLDQFLIELKEYHTFFAGTCYQIKSNFSMPPPTFRRITVTFANSLNEDDQPKVRKGKLFINDFGNSCIFLTFECLWFSSFYPSSPKNRVFICKEGAIQIFLNFLTHPSPRSPLLNPYKSEVSLYCDPSSSFKNGDFICKVGLFSNNFNNCFYFLIPLFPRSPLSNFSAVFSPLWTHFLPQEYRSLNLSFKHNLRNYSI